MRLWLGSGCGAHISANQRCSETKCYSKRFLGEKNFSSDPNKQFEGKMFYGSGLSLIARPFHWLPLFWTIFQSNKYYIFGTNLMPFLCIANTILFDSNAISLNLCSALLLYNSHRFLCLCLCSLSKSPLLSM